MMSYNKISSRLFVFVMAMFFFMIFFFLFAIPNSSPHETHDTQIQKTAANPEKDLQDSIQQASSSGPFTYGRSGLGDQLVCYKITSGNTCGKKMLLTYEIHGYEDDYPKDGQVLVDIGNAMVKYFSENRNLLKSCELYVVPSANPDGLTHGVSNDGIGRCQVSLGVNINRDFDYCFHKISDGRNQTLERPFAAPETQALRNLVQTIQPDIVIDSHGWESGFIGDTGLSDCYRKYMRGYVIQYNKPQFSANESGFFSGWAGSQGTRALLVEYPPITTRETDRYKKETASALTDIIATILS